LSAQQIAARLVAPVVWMARKTGRRPAACSSAEADKVARPKKPAASMFVRLPNLPPLAFRTASAAFRSLRYQPALLLGERRVEVQYERVGISAEFGDDERNALSHQARDERDVAREAVKLGHQDAALGTAGPGKGCR